MKTCTFLKFSQQILENGNMFWIFEQILKSRNIFLKPNISDGIHEIQSLNKSFTEWRYAITEYIYEVLTVAFLAMRDSMPSRRRGGGDPPHPTLGGALGFYLTQMHASSSGRLHQTLRYGNPKSTPSISIKKSIISIETKRRSCRSQSSGC